jgi:hypothetical protein
MALEIARQLVDSFARIVRSNGGSIGIASASDGQIIIDYMQGSEDICESGACILPHVELQDMMREWLSRRAPDCSVTVKLVRPQGSSPGDS